MINTDKQEEASEEFGGVVPKKHEDVIGIVCIYAGAIMLTAYAYYLMLGGACEAYESGKLIATFSGTGWNELAPNIMVLLAGWIFTGFAGAMIGVVAAAIILVFYAAMLNIVRCFGKIFSYNVIIK